MKKILLFIACTASVITISSQSVGINNTLPHASAILDVKSFNKGMLLPRTSTVSRNAIANPAKGLMLYDTTTAAFYFYNGSAWTQLLAANTGWNLTGNAGTNVSAHFIGTTDNKPFRIRVNNKWAGEIHPATGNTFLGLGAGNITTSGEANTAMGELALSVNTVGSFNATNGYYALAANTSGYNNTAQGTYAMTNNTTGYSNTAIGRNALFANKTGYRNTATGEGALLNNTIGNYNTSNGYQALYSSTVASYNTAHGYQALYSTTGSNNTATGYYALHNNTTGEENIAAGISALGDNNTGSNNTATGNLSLAQNTTGSYNTAVGGLALFSNIGGSGNTAIGYFAGVAEAGLYNATAIGYNATVDASDKVRIGSLAVKIIEGQVAYSFPSDARFKYNIKSNVPGLDFIGKLRPVTYYFDEQKLDTYTKTGFIDNSIAIPASNTARQVHTGFLAQEVEKIANEIGFDFDGIHAPANDRDHYSLAYSQFIMPLVKGMQEQQEQITILKTENEALKARLNKLEKLLSAN